MPDSIETYQSFKKGINRRFSRENAIDPEFFYTLQNARIMSRGHSGVVKRIKGYSKFNAGVTVYAKTLAMETYQSSFIVLYEDETTPTQFHIDIIDTAGNVTDTFSYTGQETEEGSLVVSDENIFVSPHNKVLYFKEGTWSLSDYISKIGDITSISTTDNSTPAEGIFNITSGVTSSFAGKKATATIRVVKNNTPSGETDTFQVTIGANMTGDIVVSYTDTLHDIKDKIYNALIAVTAITDDWDIKKSFNVIFGGEGSIGRLQDFTFQSQATITLVSKTVGSIWNDVVISINNSTYGIIERYNGGRIEFSPDVFSDVVNITFTITQPHGGADARINLGPLYIHFFQLGLTVATNNIVDGDTYLQLGNKILDALNAATAITNRYNISGNDTGTQFDITITAKRGGERFNTNVTVWIDPENDDQHNSYSSYFTATFAHIDGGTVSSTTGTLKNFTHYWYRVRYRFKDGHVTASTLPRYIYSGVAESVDLVIDTSIVDIDGDRAQVEVFRKEGEGERDFFMIERITPSADTTNFSDDGKARKASLEEQSNIWSKSHNAHAIVDNRYIRGGITYFDEVYSGESNIAISTNDTDDLNEAPRASEAKIYVKPQYEDGTFGYHSLIATQTFNDSGKKLRISQSNPLTNPDKTIKKLGIYARYMPRDVDLSFTFNSIELANSNIPTIADQSVYPGRTRILFGFKYLELKGESDGLYRFRIAGWTGESQDNEYTIFGAPTRPTSGGPAELSGGHPRKVTVQIFGMTYVYRRLYVESSDDIVDDDYNSIYVLDVYDALKDAVKTKQLKLRLRVNAVPDSNDLPPLTDESTLTQITKDSDKDILTQEVTVVSLLDESLQYPEVDFSISNTFWGPLDSRLYLELEESPFDDISNQNITDYSIAGRTLLSSVSTIPFELVGFELETESVMTESPIDYGFDGGAERSIDGNTHYAYQWSESVYNLINKDDLTSEDRLIYLTSKDNEVSSVADIELTGFQNVENDALNFVYNNPFNIYDLLIEKEDVNVERKTYLNQLIWSGQILSGTRYSQERNIDPENFFSLPGKYGRILRIEPLRGRLYVFCEHGVVVCAIGETIARQKDGQVVVTDSNFITSYFWLFEKLNSVKHDSIVKYGTRLFFCDGYDIYQIGQESGNLSEGAIPLDPDHQYAATIDDQNDEYKLSDITDGVTWVYNYKVQQFYGPLTYVASHGRNLNSQVIGVVGNDLVQFGQGNTFDGAAFDTIIESVANDTGKSFFDKAYRKFYLDTENDATAVFRYGKDHTNLVSVNVADMIVKQGYKHQGVQPSEKNSKVIYWELQSQDDGFALNDISWIFKQKARR